MDEKNNELEKLEKLAESFGEMGDFTQLMRESYSKLESKFEDLNSRLGRVNNLLRQSLTERNRLANYLNSILESLDSGVIVTDQDGIINIFNSAAEKYTGIKAEKALGMNYFDVFGDAASADASLVLDGDKSAVSGEKEILSTDGIVLPVAYSITGLLQFGDDDTTGMVEILYNLTETKKLESHLKKISNLAALGEMAATVAHEIRNPVAGISGFTSLLLRDSNSHDPNRKLIEKIGNGAASLEAIVGNLLDFTRDVIPETKNTDFLVLVRETVSDFKTTDNSNKHNISVECELDKISAEIDPVLFRQVVYNLLKNAVQALPDGGKIRLRISRDDIYGLVFRVEDNGAGISEEHINKLFTPFFTTKTSGTGLGLATVKKIVELHGGRIVVANKPGGGAVFTIEVPTIEGGLSEA
ncbi:MAG: ATP-binding protein [candidate division Zixibacteria bacterium]